VVAGLETYLDLFERLGGAWVGFLVLALAAGEPRRIAREFACRWPIWAPAAVAFALYGLVRVEMRFLGAFIVLLWAGLFAALRGGAEARQQILATRIAWAIAAVLGVTILWSAARGLYRVARPIPFTDKVIAQDLAELGVKPGDRVAFVGGAIADVYWARLARVKIVAETPEGYWTSAPAKRDMVIHAFAASGARVAVTADIPADADATGWRPLAGTKYSAYLLAR